MPEALFISCQQKALVKLNSPSHVEDLNTPGVLPYGCNGLRNVLLVDATDYGEGS